MPFTGNPILYSDAKYLIQTAHNQYQAATVYARLILQGGVLSEHLDWGEVNSIILKRWPKGLVRVKEMAWSIASAWQAIELMTVVQGLFAKGTDEKVENA